MNPAERANQIFASQQLEAPHLSKIQAVVPGEAEFVAVINQGKMMINVAKGIIAIVALAMTNGSQLHAQAQTIAPTDVVRPPGTKADSSDPNKLLATGTQRHGDTTLSPAGRSCNTCHLEADSYNATFKKPWPHPVQSVKAKTGLDTITAEGMVQFCMISAMGTRPLPWDSETLAALTAFVLERHSKVVQK